jgi:hypothetical protein
VQGGTSTQQETLGGCLASLDPWSKVAQHESYENFGYSFNTTPVILVLSGEVLETHV